MWTHKYACNGCSDKIDVESEKVMDPLKGSMSLHCDLYDDDPVWRSGASTGKLNRKHTASIGTLRYLGVPEFAMQLVESDVPARVTSGTEGAVTDAVYDALPPELQKKMSTVLSKTAGGQGQSGVKRLSNEVSIGGQKYTYELKFKGAFGDHRCFGTKPGQLVVFTHYEMSSSLH